MPRPTLATSQWFGWSRSSRSYNSKMTITVRPPDAQPTARCGSRCGRVISISEDIGAARQFDLTWARFHDPAEPMFVLGAFGANDARHRALHLSSVLLDAGPYVYLQDLFTNSDARGKGASNRALIEGGVCAAKAEAPAGIIALADARDQRQGDGPLQRCRRPPSGFLQYRKIL